MIWVKIDASQIGFYLLDNFVSLYERARGLSHTSLLIEGYRHETSNFLQYILLKNGYNRILPIGYITFVIVDGTTNNIVPIVTELTWAGDLTTSCYCAESQVSGIDACTIRPPEIVFKRTVDRGRVIIRVEVMHPLIQGPTVIPRF